MHHRRIERRHLLDRVGPLLRLPLEVLIQPPVPLPPRLRLLQLELLSEILTHQRVSIEPLCILRLRPAGQQPHVPQGRHRLVPFALRQPGQRVGKIRNYRRRPQYRDLVLRRGPVEEPEHPQDGELRLVLEPPLVDRHHAMRRLAFERRDGLALPDVAPLRVPDICTEQGQREAVPLIFLRRCAQLLLRSLRPACLEQLGPCFLGELVEPEGLHLTSGKRFQIRHRDPAGDEAEPHILRTQLLHERLQRRILELPLLHPRAPLQRLHPVQHQDRPLLPHQRRQPLPLVPRRRRARVGVPEPPQRSVNKLVRRRQPVGPLAVERPPEYSLRAAPSGIAHLREPSVHERALPDPAPGDDRRDVHAVGPALVEPGQLVLAAEEVAAGDGEPADGDARRRAR